MRTRVWLYPANDVLGGPIEPRVMVDADESKVYFDSDSVSPGAKRSSVFFTVEQAQTQRFLDISEEYP